MDSPLTRNAVLTAYAQSLIRFKAKQLTRKPGFSRSDEEDVAQDLTAHLLAQAHHFDMKRGSANTFADRVIRSAIAMMLRDRRRQKRAAGFVSQSLEQTSVPQDRDARLRDVLEAADLARRTGADDDAERLSETLGAVVEAFQSLPEELQDVARLLMQGSAVAVARDLGISRRQVRNAIERIRRHFEAEGLGNF